MTPVIINSTHHNVQLLNKFKGGIPRCGTIYPKIINKYDFCYKYFKDSKDSLFGKLVIMEKDMNHIFLWKNNPDKYSMKTMFLNSMEKRKLILIDT